MYLYVFASQPASDSDSVYFLMKKGALFLKANGHQISQDGPDNISVH